MASDSDIHFPPGQRRDKPAFEPPPWERDQFEELARQRREAEEAQAAANAALAQQQAAVLEAEALAQAEAPAEAGLIEELGEPVVAAGKAGAETPELDPKHVEVLMLGLRAEEPRPDEAYWKITMIAGVTSALIGMVVTTWGVVAMATPKKAGAGPILIVMMLLVFGLGFVIGGAWVVFKSLRQRGVL
jgi:hypothetical protein